MKNYQKLALLLAAGLALTACSSNTTQPATTSTPPAAVTQTAPVQPKTPESNVYKNATYGFSLTFPNTWGNIQEKTDNGPEGSKIYKVVRLTAQNDTDRFIQIEIVKTADKNDPSVKDYPQSYLAENATWSYYFTGGGSAYGMPGNTDKKFGDILKEVDAISKTFKLL